MLINVKAGATGNNRGSNGFMNLSGQGDPLH